MSGQESRYRHEAERTAFRQLDEAVQVLRWAEESAAESGYTAWAESIAAVRREVIDLIGYPARTAVGNG